jgi:hypothetical protein
MLEARRVKGRIQQAKKPGDHFAMKIGPLKALAAAGILVALGALTPASAQGGSEACRGDAYRLCNDAIPDRGKVASCLFRHKSQLSSACRAVMGGGKKAGKRHRGGKRVVRHRRHR